MSTSRTELLSWIRKRSLKTGVEVKLASGQMSNYYLDCKGVSLFGPALRDLSVVFWDHLKSLDSKIESIAGVSVGGDPIVAGILLKAAEENQPLKGLLVRKEPKAHGMSKGRAVDGAEPKDCGRVWLVEDVISTGGSSLTAAKYLLAEGYQLAGIAALIDREMGGVAHLKKELGVPVECVFSVSRILDSNGGNS